MHNKKSPLFIGKRGQEKNDAYLTYISLPSKILDGTFFLPSAKYWTILDTDTENSRKKKSFTQYLLFFGLLFYT